MIPKKPAPHLMRGGCRFSEKIMRKQNVSDVRARGLRAPARRATAPDQQREHARERERDRDRPGARAEQLADDDAARWPRRPSARRRAAMTPCRRDPETASWRRRSFAAAQTHAERVDRHRGDERDGDAPPSGTAATVPTPPSASASAAEADGAVEPDARDDARRERRAGEKTAARRREREPERQRREAIDLLQHVATSRRSRRTRPRSSPTACRHRRAPRGCA